jgi:translation initiation factor 6
MNFHGDHNLGLFGKACDKFFVLTNFVTDKNLKKLEEVLKSKSFKTTITNTDLVGIFTAFNSNGILLPRIVTKIELANFKKLAESLGINRVILKSRFTALGNLILCNDKGAVISKNLRAEKKKIEDCLGVETEYATISNMNVLGTSGIATNKGCLVHRDADESEIEKIQEVLKVKTDIGTANFGSPFVGSCIIANSHGAVIGESTTGAELARIQETLDLL